MKNYRILSGFVSIIAVIIFFGSCSYSTSKERKVLKTDPALLKIFNNAPQEKLKNTLWTSGYTTISNEDRLDLYYRKFDDIGGGYFGVGSIQNFMLASWANSEWIWLMDFTQIVTVINRVHIAIFKAAKNPVEFMALWKHKNKDKAMKIIKKEYAGDPDLKHMIKSWDTASHYLNRRFELLLYLTKQRNYDIWLNCQKYYDRMRNLALNGRIIALKGDLTRNKTFIGVANNAKKMGVTMRILYFSNAEEYFKVKPGVKKAGYPAQFRKNVLAMPFDEKSIIVRTISVKRRILPWAPDHDYSIHVGFHYSMMPGLVFQKMLKNPEKYNYVVDVMKAGKVYGKTGFSQYVIKKDSKKSYK